MNCYAMRDLDGNVLQHRGLMLDISGLHQSQTELQKERDFSGKILSHTQSLILVTDTEGVISYANRRWSGLGFQQNQILAHLLPDLCAIPRRRPLCAKRLLPWRAASRSITSICPSCAAME
jgi:PAS domain-containing protein